VGIPWVFLPDGAPAIETPTGGSLLRFDPRFFSTRHNPPPPASLHAARFFVRWCKNIAEEPVFSLPPGWKVPSTKGWHHRPSRLLREFLQWPVPLPGPSTLARCLGDPPDIFPPFGDQSNLQGVCSVPLRLFRRQRIFPPFMPPPQVRVLRNAGVYSWDVWTPPLVGWMAWSMSKDLPPTSHVKTPAWASPHFFPFPRWTPTKGFPPAPLASA